LGVSHDELGIEQDEDLQQLLNADRAWVCFDIGHARLTDSESFGEVGLCQAARFAHGAQVLLELAMNGNWVVHVNSLSVLGDICNISYLGDILKHRLWTIFTINLLKAIFS